VFSIFDLSKCLPSCFELYEQSLSLYFVIRLGPPGNQMETRQLGNSDLHITCLGIGAWAIGGSGWNGSMGPQNEDDSIPAIHAALDHGLNWIDTAALYGLGHSEDVIARALRGRSQRPYIFIKCERVWDSRGTIGDCLKAASIRKECEDSLRRLQSDVIDLYQIHWPEPDADIEEGWTELARLKQEGKVRYIGVSNFSVSQMERAQAIAAITSLQPPYSIITREIEKDILPFVLENNIGVIVYSPMSAGLLTGAMTRERVANFSTEDGVRIFPTSRSRCYPAICEWSSACAKSETATSVPREKSRSHGLSRTQQ
jgi:aryl-alcohol dehydrogenase-like predicted oxidoreductase